MCHSGDGCGFPVRTHDLLCDTAGLADKISDTMQGIIIKGVGGFYQVHVPGSGTYTCRARGIFRLEQQKPLVGDRVVIESSDDMGMVGTITAILPRFNELIRPSAANADQALIVFAVQSPAPNLFLLDQYLVMLQRANVRPLLCFNKMDLNREAGERWRACYLGTGFPVFLLSLLTGEGVEELRSALAGTVTVLCGPSGVGKSSLLNALVPDAQMETGELSEKLKRGRHTTRYAQLFLLPGEAGGYVMDTPGFTSFSLGEMRPEELSAYMPEFAPYERSCRFQPCSHRREPDCAVRDAVDAGEIEKSRYDNYVQLYEQLRLQKPKNWS